MGLLCICSLKGPSDYIPGGRSPWPSTAQRCLAPWGSRDPTAAWGAPSCRGQCWLSPSPRGFVPAAFSHHKWKVNLHIFEKKIISVSSGQPEWTWPGVGAQCTFCSQGGLPAGLSGSSMTAGLLCKPLSHLCKAWKDPLRILQRNDCCLTSNAVDFIPGSVMDLQSNFRQGAPLHCAAAAPVTNTIPTFISHFATS